MAGKTDGKVKSDLLRHKEAQAWYIRIILLYIFLFITLISTVFVIYWIDRTFSERTLLSYNKQYEGAIVAEEFKYNDHIILYYPDKDSTITVKVYGASFKKYNEGDTVKTK